MLLFLFREAGRDSYLPTSGSAALSPAKFLRVGPDDPDLPVAAPGCGGATPLPALFCPERLVHRSRRFTLSKPSSKSTDYSVQSTAILLVLIKVTTPSPDGDSGTLRPRRRCNRRCH